MRWCLRIFVICATAFPLSPVLAQDVNLGLKGGLNLATLGNRENNLIPRFGYHGGLVATVPLVGNLLLQPEVLLSLQGATDESISERKNRYHYLNFPLLGRIAVTSDAYVNLGAQLGFLLTASIKDPVQDQNVTDQLRSFDIGVAVGVGFRIVSKLELELRYVNGINNTSIASPGSDVKFQNKVLQLSLAYLFK